MKKLQLGWNTRAIFSGAGTLGGSSWRAPFSPLISWCSAQFFAQPSTRTGIVMVSTNTTPFRPWKLQINTRRFSSFPDIFSCAGKHAHIHESIFTKRTCSITQNKKSARFLRGLIWLSLRGQRMDDKATCTEVGLEPTERCWGEAELVPGNGTHRCSASPCLLTS